MTKAKAATVTAALITAGYEAHATPLQDGSWEVYANSLSGKIDVDVVKSFKDAQSVACGVNSAVFT